MTSPKRRSPLVLSAAIVALAAACEQEAHERWIGPHLEYVWDSRFEPCAGTFASMDGFLPFAADQLAVDLDALGDLTYLWLSLEELRALQGRGEGGVTVGRHVFTTEPVAWHELVHLVQSGRLSLGGPRFITEGIAVALDPPHFGGPRFERVDPRPYLDQGYLEGYDFYAPAGAFVAYLLSMYGPEPLFEVYERLTLGAADATFERAFADVYGLDLDDEVERYQDADTCPEGASALPIAYECAAPRLPSQGRDRWSYARRLTCADDDVAGEPGAMFTTVSLDIPADGEYQVDVAGDAFVRFVLLPCGPCPWLAIDEALVTSGSGSLRVHLGRGVHGLRVEAGEDSLFAVSIRRVDVDGPGE